MPVADIRIGVKLRACAEKRELRRLCIDRRKSRPTDERSRLDNAVVSRMTDLPASDSQTPFCFICRQAQR